DREDYVPRRTEYFNTAGDLLKIRTFDQVHTIGGHPTPLVLRMETVPAGASSTITLSGVTYRGMPECAGPGRGAGGGGGGGPPRPAARGAGPGAIVGGGPRGGGAPPRPAPRPPRPHPGLSLSASSRHSVRAMDVAALTSFVGELMEESGALIRRYF